MPAHLKPCSVEGLEYFDQTYCSIQEATSEVIVAVFEIMNEHTDEQCIIAY